MNRRNPELHSLLNLNGKTIVPFLTNLVASKHSWATDKEHLFYQRNEKKPVMAILPNPTKNQPGNGKISFLQADGSFNAPKYDDPSFQYTVLNPDFRQAYNRWNTENLDQTNFQSVTEQANLLLRFEQIRRVETNGDFLSRNQIASGINIVMGVTDQQYPTQVSWLLDLLQRITSLELSITSLELSITSLELSITSVELSMRLFRF